MTETATEAPQIVRRHLGTTPGTTLLMTQDALGPVREYMTWLEVTGMTPQEVLTESLCAAPLPVPPEFPAGPRAYSHVNPAMLWHPLFWLPKRLALPYRIENIDPEEGGPIQESADGWSVRVALEVTLSGLYEPQQGWADVMNMVGIDVDTPEGVDRIAAWQAGAPDQVLDTLDLDRYLFREDDPQWSMKLAAELEPILRDARWALLSDAIAEDLMDARDEPDFARSREAVALACNLGAALLDKAPGPEGAPPAGDMFDKVGEAARTWTADRASFESGPVNWAYSWVVAVRDRFWPAVESFNEMTPEAA